MSERLGHVTSLIVAAMLVAVPIGLVANGTPEPSGTERNPAPSSVRSPMTVPSATAAVGGIPGNGGKAATRNVVKARSTTDNIVGEVFARAVNEAMGDGGDERESLFDEDTLEEYPVESHEPAFYANTHRLRRLVGDSGTDVGFLAYRDSFLIVPQDEAKPYDVSWSDDERTAYVTPAPDPDGLAGKDGLVLIREDVGKDDIMVLDGQPEVDGDTLVVPTKTAEELSFNQLFSDGSISYSSRVPKSRLRGALSGASVLYPESAGSPRLLGDSFSIENLIGMDFTPSGTNWSCRLSNPSLGDIGADYDIDIWDLKFDLVVKAGINFDFDVTSTGSSGGKESKKIASLVIPLGLFSLRYDCLFEAEFDGTPVHVTGHMENSLDYHLNPLIGPHVENFRAPITLHSFKLVNPERDKNKEIKCYLGSGFRINAGVLSLDIPIIDVEFGPVLSLDQYSRGGCTITGRLDKDLCSESDIDRTRESYHTCACEGEDGCYAIHTDETSKHDIDIVLDLFFKDWSWPLHDGVTGSLSQEDYYDSLTNRTGLKKGICPDRLFRVPVSVYIMDGTSRVPVEGLRVSESGYVGHELPKADVTDQDGKADVFLPYAAGARRNLMATGTYKDKSVIGSARQPSEMRMGLNDEVIIFIRGTETTSVIASAQWDTDMDGEDIPFNIRIAVEMRAGPQDDWHLIAWSILRDEPISWSEDIDEDALGDWGWGNQWPKYSMVNGEYVVNEFRVRELDEFKGDDSDWNISTNSKLDNGWAYLNIESGKWYESQLGFIDEAKEAEFTEDDLRAIREEEADRSATEENPYIDYEIWAYTDSKGASFPAHRTEYRVDYQYEEEAGESDGDTANTISRTVMRNTAVTDIDITKMWKLSDDATKPQSVYVTAVQQPMEEWVPYAREQGMTVDWIPAQNPVAGSSMTLRDLIKKGVISWVNVYNIEDVPLAISEIGEDNGWATSYKLRKYRDGVPLEFKAKELESVDIGMLLDREYKADQPATVLTGWNGTSIVGTPYMQSKTAKMNANIINADTSADHTIGGTIFWYNTIKASDHSHVELPEYVTIHVRDANGTEVAAVRVNRDDFAEESDIWIWTLEGENIDSSESYTIYEEFPEDKQVLFDGDLVIVTPPAWFGEARGLDVINHWTVSDVLSIRISASIDAAPENVPKDEPLSVDLMDENGTVLGTYSLPYDAKTKTYEDVVLAPNGRTMDPHHGLTTPNSPYAGKDVARYSIRVNNPESASTDSNSKIFTIYQPPTVSFKDDYDPRAWQTYSHPTYNFHATNVVQGPMRINVDVKWESKDGTEIPDGAIPDSVSMDVFRNDEQTVTKTAKVLASDGWKALVTGTTDELPHLTEDGSGLHAYSVVPAHVDGFRESVLSADTETSNPRYTITYTYVGDRSVTAKGTVKWVDDAGWERFRSNPTRIAIMAQRGDDAKSSHTVHYLDLEAPQDGSSDSVSWEAPDLPRYDEDGTELRYSVLEGYPFGYDVTYAEPVFDEATRTWTLDVTNRLSGYVPITIKKEIEGASDPDAEYSFQVTPLSDDFPPAIENVVKVKGRGETKAEFIIGVEGASIYSIRELGEDDDHCTYDKSESLLLIVASRDEDGHMGIKTWTARIEDPDDQSSTGGEPSPEGGRSLTEKESAAITEAMNGETSDAVTFTNKCPEVIVKKTWDIDLEKNDRPDSIQVVLQKKNGDKWETVNMEELGSDNDWKASFSPESGDGDKAEYRVRELREETALETLRGKVKDLIGKDGTAYDDIIGLVKGSSYWEYLPEAVRTAADGGYEKLAEKLGTTSEETYDKLMDEIELSTSGSRIVYDEDDSDKPSGDDAKTNEVVYHVGAHASVVSGGTEDAHTTKYKVTYEDDGKNGFTITNKAIVEVDVIKRWIGVGVDDEDMPDSAWVVLMAKPKAGSLDAAGDLASAAGVDLGGVLDYEFPVINPIEGGNNPISIISELTIGVKLDFLDELDVVPKLAIGKVDKDCDWKMTVVAGKYVAGIPMEYKGAELSSEIIRQIIKYVSKGTISLPVSYNPFDNYISIPTSAIRTPMGLTDLDLSGLSDKALAKAKSLTLDDIKGFGPETLLDDHHLMANVINVKVDWDTNEDEDDPDEPTSDDTISGKKTWDDDNDKYGMRPDEITIRLLANGKEKASVKTSKAGGWKYFFTDCPEKDDEGKMIEYTIEEDEVPGYETVIDGYDVTNRSRLEALTISKTWEDEDDQDGMRPDSITVHLLKNGQEIASHEITADDGWKWETEERYPTHEDGKEIEYTVTEDPVDGYTTETDGLKVTNTHVPETVILRPAKKWDDQDNQDGIRPKSVTLRLYANGNEVRSFVVSSERDWDTSVEMPRLDEDGKSIEYTIGEDSVDGYEQSIDGLTVTNTHRPETVTISGSKRWDDGDDRDGLRPDSITVILMADGKESDRKTVTVEDEWKWSFEGMPRRKDGEEIAYTIDESPVPEGYEKDIDGYDITNTHAPETTEVTGQKIWDDDNDRDGNRPDRITVSLLDGDEVVDTQVVTEVGGWKWMFAGVPKKRDGKEIRYTVREEPVDGYKATYDGTGITNSYSPETVTIEGHKTWDDDDNASGSRPESITVRLYADGREVASKEVTADDGWSWSFEGQPKRLNGKEVTYTVGEDVIDGYEVTASGYDLTNRKAPGKTQVNVRKSWDDGNDRDGRRPDSVTVRLIADGTDTGKTITLDDDNKWCGSFTGLDVTSDGGETISYTIAEDPTDGYETSVSGGDGERRNSFTLTNTHRPETMSVRGHKEWDDNDDEDAMRPERIVVRLIADGTPVAWQEVTETDGSWEWEFKDVPKFSGGREIAYSVSEDAIDGYSSSVEGNATDGFTIRNTKKADTVRVTVRKSWDDAGNRDGMRPSSVRVTLLENGQETGMEATLDQGSGWQAKFADLPRRKGGKEVEYDIREEDVPSYEPTVTRTEDASDVTLLVSNRHVPETVSINGTKHWKGETPDGGLPKSITIRLKADGIEVASRQVTAEDGWKWTFGDLPRRRDGREIAYATSEDAIAGYESETNGHDVTNTYTPGKAQVGVTKVWDDNDDKAGRRPDSVTIRLIADGKETEKKLTLSAEDGWVGSFKGLPAAADGKAISYAVKEEPVDGYKCEISGDATVGYTIVNSYEKTTPPSDEETFYTITYVLNGGTYDGKTDDIRETYPAGTQIAIHEAPTMEGHEFVCWKGSEYMPGDPYVVTGDHTFVAQWKATTPPGDDTPPDDDDPPGKRTPPEDKTPDDGNNPPAGSRRKTTQSQVGRNGGWGLPRLGDLGDPALAAIALVAATALGIGAMTMRRRHDS